MLQDYNSLVAKLQENILKHENWLTVHRCSQQTHKRRETQAFKEPYSFYFHVFSVSSSAVSCGSRDRPARCHCACARDSVLSGKIYRRQQERRSAIDKHRVERTGRTTVLSSLFYYFILMSSVVSVENSCPTKGAGVPFKRGSSWGKGSIRGSILFGGKSGWMDCWMGERMDG